MGIKSLDEVRRIKARAEDSLLRIRGVTGVDIRYGDSTQDQTSEPAIRVYVKDKNDDVTTRQIPKVIEGVNVEIVEREFVPH